MKFKKAAAMLMIAVLCMLSSSCVMAEDAADDGIKTETENVLGDTDNNGEMTVPTTSKKDLDSSWDSVAGTISLSGATITTTGTGVSTSGNTATITAAGTYAVSGTLTDGQIVVNATKDDHVRLVL